MHNLKFLIRVLTCLLVYFTASGHAVSVEPQQQSTPASSNPDSETSMPIDVRIQVHLDKAKLKYTTNKEGVFEVIAPTSAGRSQKCFIHSRTDKFKEAPGMAFRRILSPAIFLNEPLSAQLMDNLLQESAIMKIGHWGVIKNESNQYMLFCMATVAADADYETLLFTAGMVAAIADAKELKLTNKDKH